jgi:diguanylate cyclase (GGDEF)-like protein
MSAPAPRFVRIAYIALGLWLLTSQVRNLVDRHLDLGPVFDKQAGNVVVAACAVLVFVRVARVAQDRLAWALVGVALCAWTLGNVWWMTVLYDLAELPIPSVADIGFLAFPPLLAVGCVLMLRSRQAGTDGGAGRWLDATAAAMAIAAVSAAIVFDAVAGVTSGTLVEITVTLAYPVTDLILLATVVGALASRGWALERRWVLLAAGMVIFVVADSAYLVENLSGAYAAGDWYDMGWPAGMVLVSLAAWQPAPAESSADEAGLRRAAMPLVFALVAVGMLIYGTIEEISPVPIALAAIALLALMGRLVLTLRENSLMLRTSRIEAVTDALTGLGNRRALAQHLDAAGQDRPTLLALFDLDGFKHYNDSYGHPAGDALLVRLASRLTAHLGIAGVPFRMGGDEFCVLWDSPEGNPDDLAGRAAESLSESGEGFRVGCSVGSVMLPREAEHATQALQLADQRLYAVKTSGRASASRQSRDVLLRALVERSPELEGHLQHVAVLAEATARHFWEDAETLEQVRHAAELHDIGKVAIPDAILRKPSPLDAAEWDFIRRHTTIGERIIAAAPALRGVARLVRSTHERWDGTGYPDRLAGEAIPLGARIIFVADAFDAMISERPYSPAQSVEAALAELVRCAGSHFDPGVVEIFCDLVRKGPTESTPSAGSTFAQLV